MLRLRIQKLVPGRAKLHPDLSLLSLMQMSAPSSVRISEEEKLRLHTPPVSVAAAYSSDILILCHLGLGS